LNLVSKKETKPFSKVADDSKLQETPFTPCNIISFTPPLQAFVNTGFPKAFASSTILGKPSYREVSKSASA